MKIAVTSTGDKPVSLLDRRFGRCASFAIYDTESKAWSFVNNPGSLQGSGAGVKAAQFMVELNVDVLLTGDLGPNAARILSSAGVRACSLPEVSLLEAIRLYEQGHAQKMVGPTVEAHAGLDLASSNSSEGPVQGEKGFAFEGRVALATEGSDVAGHFGRCSSYSLVDIEKGRIVNKYNIANPGHQPGFLPRFLGEKGVQLVIAGGMGPRAQDLFAAQGIQTVVGVAGSIEETLQALLAGKLAEGESLCQHGEHGHEHSCGS